MNYLIDFLGGGDMARENTSFGFDATMLIIPAGASNALLVKPIANEISMSLKYGAGNTLEIFKAVSGGTQPATAISLGNGYPIGANEIVNATGAPRFFLAATGATTTAFLLIGLSQDG